MTMIFGCTIEGLPLQPLLSVVHLSLCVFKSFEKFSLSLLHLLYLVVIIISLLLSHIKFNPVFVVLLTIIVHSLIHAFRSCFQLLIYHFLLQHHSVLLFERAYLVSHVHTRSETPVHVSLHVQSPTSVFILLLSYVFL